MSLSSCHYRTAPSSPPSLPGGREVCGWCPRFPSEREVDVVLVIVSGGVHVLIRKFKRKLGMTSRNTGRIMRRGKFWFHSAVGHRPPHPPPRVCAEAPPSPGVGVFSVSEKLTLCVPRDHEDTQQPRRGERSAGCQTPSAGFAVDLHPRARCQEDENPGPVTGGGVCCPGPLRAHRRQGEAAPGTRQGGPVRTSRGPRVPVPWQCLSRSGPDEGTVPRVGSRAGGER